MSGQRRLVWLIAALIDLNRLRDFVWVNSPAAAAKMAKRINEAANKLVAHPFLGRPVTDIDPPHQFRDFFIPFGKGGYVLRYAVADNAVILVKIWHSRENRSLTQSVDILNL